MFKRERVQKACTEEYLSRKDGKDGGKNFHLLFPLVLQEKRVYPQTHKMLIETLNLFFLQEEVGRCKFVLTGSFQVQ